MEKNTIPVHGNTNKRNGRALTFEKEVKQDLVDFFEHLKEFAQPQSNRFVRENCGTGLCDGQDAVLVLEKVL